MGRIEIYDTTLRDGSQQAGISFSLHDKLAIVQKLDGFVDYIELGWPGSNPKDSKVFKTVKRNPPKNAKIVAFGMTCQKGKNPEDDPALRMLLDAQTEVISIVGKSSRYQAEQILGVSGHENLRIIEQTCWFLVGQGKVVFFDAEHFFDGFKADKDYAIACLGAATRGGASRLVLCDTNGGSLPSEIASIVKATKKKTELQLGIHAHNDGEMAVANSLAAVESGANQVQMTVNGYGERCGNANICSVVPALKAKMGLDCVSDKSMAQLMALSHFVAEIANLALSPCQPYVGRNAFCDKGGLHASAACKDSASYRHINPARVGNKASVVVSELSGKSNVLMKAAEFGIQLSPQEVKFVLAEVEKKESKGFHFEGADGSLKLIMLRVKPEYIAPFEICYSNVESESFSKGRSVNSAIVKVKINNGRNDLTHEVANGDGLVNALDVAMRKALLRYYPHLEYTKLVDYKVRVLPGKKGTAKAVRVLIDFSDEHEEWSTVGCSTNLIEASKQALADGLEFAILKAQ